MKISFLAALAVLLAGQTAAAQTAYDRAWERPDPLIVLDSYELNRIDWNQVVRDRNVKGVIHRAFIGLRQDRAFERRVRETRDSGLLAGAYLLGLPGNPIAQADALVDAAERTGVRFLALDIENLDETRSMSLPNAIRFIERVHARSGRYPAFYTNWSTYQHISRTYPPDSVFSRTPLWVARFRSQLGDQDRRIWRDYSLWQFCSEINCKPCPAAYGGPQKSCRKRADGVIVNEPCSYRVPGTATDMDVNVFNGTEQQLRALFQ